MKTIIEINNVSYIKKGNIILDSIDFRVNQGEFVSIVGASGAGKSSLVRILLGLEKCNQGNITIFGKLLHEDRNEILKHIGVIFENPTDTFVTNKVSDELMFSLKNMNISLKEIEVRLKEVSSYLRIEYLLDYIPHSLSGGEKQLVALASALMLHPDILIIDESLDMVDVPTKEKILSLLKKIRREKKMTIIYVTQDLEDTLYTDRIVLLTNGKVCLDEKLKNAFENDKIYRNADLSLPFVVELSKKLQYYNLIDKMEFNMDKLVNKLWK